MDERSQRIFALQPRGGPGLTCDGEGLALGGIPLADVAVDETGRRTCSLRSRDDIERVLKLVDGSSSAGAISRLLRGLQRAADALAVGDLPKAAMEAVFLRAPQIDQDAMARLAAAHSIAKNGTAWQGQPRLPSGQSGGGQWTSDDIGGDLTGSAQTADRTGARTQSTPQSAATTVRQSHASLDLNAALNEPALGAPTTPTPVGEQPIANATVGEVDVAATDEIANRDYHDEVVAKVARIIQKLGCRVVTEIPLTAVNGITTRADILMMTPRGQLFIIEVKTGVGPKYQDNQRLIYPMAMIGGHVFSTDPRIVEFGFEPGERLPPMGFDVAYKRDRKTRLQIISPGGQVIAESPEP